MSPKSERASNAPWANLTDNTLVTHSRHTLDHIPIGHVPTGKSSAAATASPHTSGCEQCESQPSLPSGYDRVSRSDFGYRVYRKMTWRQGALRAPVEDPQ